MKENTAIQKGTIIAVRGPIVDISFPETTLLPSIYELVSSKTVAGSEVIMEVVEQLKGNIIRCICLTSNMGLVRNSEAIAKGSFIMMPDSENCYGRLMNAFGAPLDDKGPIQSAKMHPIRKRHLKNREVIAMGQKREYRIMITGIKIIDLLFPLVTGSKTGILGGAACGKSVITLEIINNIVAKTRGSCVFTGAGERIREGNELYLEMKEKGILDKVALIYGQMNESPGIRYEVVFSGVTVAESMQEKGEDVIFFVDNVFRFAQAGAELSALMGRIPSETGYQPTLISEVSEFHERIHSDATSSITSIEAVYVPADDLSDPAVVAIFSQLDSIIVLSRAHVQKGLYPAIDPISSSSSFLDAAIIGKRHFDIANEAKRLFQKYEELQKLVAVIGVDELSQEERTLYERAQKLQNFMTQPFFVAERYTSRPGEFVELEDTLRGCEMIINGEVDDKNASEFYLIGKLSA